MILEYRSFCPGEGFDCGCGNTSALTGTNLGQTPADDQSLKYHSVFTTSKKWLRMNPNSTLGKESHTNLLFAQYDMSGTSKEPTKIGLELNGTTQLEASTMENTRE